jgi:superfamily I DNA/RNA helicase
MRSLDYARTQARDLRQSLGGSSDDLSNQLRNLLWERYEIELVPVDSQALLQGGRAEVVPAEGCLYYDRRLDNRPAELLEVIAHEYGHLVLHHDSFAAAQDDLIRGSVFLDSGTSRLSRYSPRSEQESQASAFAAELICPAGELFGRWRRDTDITLATVASEYHATESLIRLQLAEGLYLHVTGQSVLVCDGELEREPTKEQERAATFCGAPALVDAGPGTGKTKTLVRRVVYLIRERKIPPERILVLTFSNEAAAELQERIQKILDTETASRMHILTFHGFGVLMLNALGHHVGLNVDFSILDETCQEEFISEILGAVDCEALLDIKNPEQTAAEVAKQINYLKDRLIGPTALRAAIDTWQPAQNERDALLRSEALYRLFEAYERNIKARNQVDFADLILLPHQILSTNDEVSRGIREEFPWVLVDEYQDVSRSTALLLQQICGEDSPPWVVGDARQAIYRFRGAEPENVSRFAEDFPGANLFELSNNYRSAPEIISVVNRLAALLDVKTDDPNPERWRSGSNITALNDAPVVMAVANSDAAEREGVAGVVEQWLSQRVAAQDIAVLARRNVDVRNIAIELKRRGIRAITSGILTAEGAGGDLAAVLTTVDHQLALPRLVYALAHDIATPEELNRVIEQLLNADPEREVHEWTGSTNTKEIAENTWRVFRMLRSFLHSGDGWIVLCEFLFFLTPYLRILLEESDAASSVQLEEVLSALSLAAHYRISHLHVQPRKSRIGLAERLRSLVTQAVPGLVPPQNHPDAVRVMTCHASKGLEFPCAAVAGQSLPDIWPIKPCLPPTLRPNPEDDLLQAESLLFVGLSRAQRAAVISYATSASGSPRSKPRRFPELLTKLQQSGAIPIQLWTTTSAVNEEIRIGRIWGGDSPAELSLYSLGSKTCMVKIYLQEQLGARFRSRLRPLYPEFTRRVRSMLERIVQSNLENGEVPPEVVAKIVDEEWPVELLAEHPHVALYRPRALRWTQRFAQTLQRNAFGQGTPYQETFELKDLEGTERTLKLQLVGHFRDVNGDRVVIAMQPCAPRGFTGAVKWSDLKDYQLLPFVLLHERHRDVRPLLFFGEEGQIVSFKWHKHRPDQARHEHATRAQKVFDDLSSGVFEATIDDWTCDRCPSRIICPCWIGAARSPGN